MAKTAGAAFSAIMAAASRTYTRPAAGLLLGGGLPHRPHAQLIGGASSRPSSAAESCDTERVERPTSTSGPATRRASAAGHVALAHVHPVGAALSHKIGTVVQPEQRAMLGARPPEYAGGAHELGPRRCLVLQLHHVHAARTTLPLAAPRAPAAHR